MEQRIGDVARAEDDFRTMFGNLETMINTLQTEWQGKASQSFYDQFTGLKGKAFNPMLTLLGDLRQQMVETLRAIETLDYQIAGKFN